MESSITPRTRPIAAPIQSRSASSARIATCSTARATASAANCGEPLDANDDAWEPDPDDARDAMMDRMLDQRWDSD